MENQQEVTEQCIQNQSESEFSINAWFNDLKYKGSPIRILGTTDEPFFYASEIADILKIKSVRSSTRTFSKIDIVSQEQRERLGLVATKVHRGKEVRDDRIILLTEYGVYKLIMLSRTKCAEEFREFICIKIGEIRRSEKIKLKTLADRSSTIEEENKNMKEHLKLYKELPITYVYKVEIKGRRLDKVIPRKDLDWSLYKEQLADGEIFDGALYKYTSKRLASDMSNMNLSYVVNVNIDEIIDELENCGNDFPNNGDNSSAVYAIGISPRSLEVAYGRFKQIK